MRLILAVCIISLLLSACAREVQTQVTRFHEGKLPAGETFTVEPAEPARQGPEFRTYARLILEEMRQYGYRPTDEDPDLRVVVSYDVGEGRTEVETYGHPYYGYHLGRFRPHRHGVLHAHHFGGFYGPEIRSRTVYTRRLQLEIVDANTGEVQFEGRALSEGSSQELSQVMPYLVEAMFRNFPGESGTTKVVEIETREGQRY
jgi:hypothetical protein